jgi:5-formyltetrahydrofolate cyclo-ligase
MPFDFQNKNHIRQNIRQKRKNQTEAYRYQASKQIAEQLMHWLSFQSQRQVAVFLAMSEEINTDFVIDKLRENACTVYLPIVHPYRSGLLFFQKYHASTYLVKNQIGVREPAFNPYEIIAPWELDVVLVPLVAFDKARHRLGMGGGFYDQTFAFTRYHHELKLYGLAFECQKLEHCPYESWDLALDGIITERTIY